MLVGACSTSVPCQVLSDSIRPFEKRTDCFYVDYNMARFLLDATLAFALLVFSLSLQAAALAPPFYDVTATRIFSPSSHYEADKCKGSEQRGSDGQTLDWARIGRAEDGWKLLLNRLCVAGCRVVEIEKGLQTRGYMLARRTKHPSTIIP